MNGFIPNYIIKTKIQMFKPKHYNVFVNINVIYIWLSCKHYKSYSTTKMNSENTDLKKQNFQKKLIFYS